MIQLVYFFFRFIACVYLFIISIIIINFCSGSIYKYNGSSPYKLKIKYKENIHKRIKTVKIIYKVYMINIRVP